MSIALKEGLILLAIRNITKIKKPSVITLVVVSVIGLCYFKDQLKRKPYYADEWGLLQIDAAGMWKYIGCANLDTSVEIIVAIIDSGIDLRHKDLQNYIFAKEIIGETGEAIDVIHGWDFLRNVSINSFDHRYTGIGNHGTACAGIITSVINDTANVKLLSLRVLDGDTYQGSIEDVIAAIKFAEQMGAKVCNLSLSVKQYSDELKNVIESSSMLFVVSSGNSFPFSLNLDRELSSIYPACFRSENMIVTASIDKNLNLSSTSNYGLTTVDIVAPGEGILTTMPSNRYEYVSGTSFSVPFITAVAAVLFYQNPNATANDVKIAILDSATEIDTLEGKVGGNRMLNAYHAVISFERGSD